MFYWYQASSQSVNVSKQTSTISTQTYVSVAASDFAATDITITPASDLELCKADGTAYYLSANLVAVEFNATQYAGTHFAGDSSFRIDLSDLALPQYAGKYTITIAASGTARIAKAVAEHTNKATCVGTTQEIVLTLVIGSDGAESISSTDQAKVNSYDLTSHILTFTLKTSVGPKTDTTLGALGTATDESGQDGKITVSVVTAASQE